MSYLLEALERADRERKLGQYPQLIDAQLQPQAPRRRLHLWVALGAVLAINALLLLLLLLSRAQPDQPVAATERRVPATSSERGADRSLQAPDEAGQPAPAFSADYGADSGAPAATAPKRQAPSLPGPVNALATGDRGPANPRGKLTSDPRLPGAPKALAAASAESRSPQAVSALPPLPAIPDEPAYPIQDPARRGLESSARQRPMASAGAAAAALPSADMATVAAGSEPDSAAIPLVQQLPMAEQSKFAGLTLNVHVFHPDPAQRFVIVNMRRYKEGERLPRNGLLLERITREGAIIDYGGGKARLEPGAL